MRVATLDRAKLKAAWTDPGMLATPLFILWLDSYVVGLPTLEEQTAVLNWHPETVKMEIESDFQVVVPQPNLDRILAAREIFATNRFHTVLPDFIDLCNVLSGSTFDPETFDLADAVECAWGITEGLLLDPPDDGAESHFADEIVAYVGAIVDREGLIRPPDVLKIGENADRSKSVGDDWSDDPIMFASIWKAQEGKADDINRIIRSRLSIMVGQIESLSLMHGDTVAVVDKILRAIPRTVPRDSAAA